MGALLTSCHIPLYANGRLVTKYRGGYYVDGGVTDFLPSPPSVKVVKVCCFPVNRAFARLHPSLQVQSARRIALCGSSPSNCNHDLF